MSKVDSKYLQEYSEYIRMYGIPEIVIEDALEDSQRVKTVFEKLLDYYVWGALNKKAEI